MESALFMHFGLNPVVDSIEDLGNRDEVGGPNFYKIFRQRVDRFHQRDSAAELHEIMQLRAQPVAVRPGKYRQRNGRFIEVRKDVITRLRACRKIAVRQKNAFGISGCPGRINQSAGSRPNGV